MRAPVLLGLLLLCAAPASLATAGASPEQVWPDEALLRDPTSPSYVVVVREVETRAATNASPPHARVEVVEALRGELAPGTVVDSVWQPMPHDIDTGGREAELKAWSKTPLAGPDKGATLIVLCVPWGEPPGGLSISCRCRYPFSDEARARVREQIALGEKERHEQERVRAAEKERLQRDRAADAEEQSLADVPALCAAADEVLIARCESTGWGGDPRHRTLTLTAVRRLKPAAGAAETASAGAVFVTAPSEVDRLLLLRGREGEFVFFVRRVPGRLGGSGTAPDSRELVGLSTGFLLATGDLVDRVRATLEGRTGR